MAQNDLDATAVMTDRVMTDPGNGGCGVLALADLRAAASHELLSLALAGIQRMEHRGGSLEDTGDGAGVLIGTERSFFERFISPGRTLPSEEEPLIVGLIAALPGERNMPHYRREVDAVMRRRGLRPMGWRQVPVEPEVLGARARQDVPQLHQVLLAKGNRRESQLRRVLYLAKGSIERRFAGALTVVSLGEHSTVYKVLGTGSQLAAFFPDLRDPDLKTRAVVGHRRFATNTFSSWHLVQPFRLLAHNGEINTINTNVRAVRDLDSAIGVPCPLMHHGSDSAHLDRVAEMMSAHGMSSVAEALRRMIPPAWRDGPEPDDRQRRFWEGNRRAMGSLGAWEGPAAVAATDGKLVLGLLDRMGLRPLRYTFSRAGRLVIASEAGVVPMAPAEVEADGQLEPGELIIGDLESGELVPPSRATRWIIERSGLNFGGLASDDLVPMEAGDDGPGLSPEALNRFGWSAERVRRLRKTAAASRSPVHSMGNDLPLAIFSENHSRLYSYLNQIVAVVTNPPIDPLREGGAMDTTVYLGRSPQVTKYSAYETWPQYRLEHPVMCTEQVASLFMPCQPHLRALRLDATYASAGAAPGESRQLVRRIHDLTDEALAVVRKGISILVLSDMGAAQGDRLPLPMVLLTGAVHRALARAGLRRDASIVVETGEVHEGHDLAVLLAYGATAVNPYAMLHLARTVKGVPADQAARNLVGALVRSVRRIMSKMGITTMDGYRGSALFEAIGLSGEVVDYFIPDTVTRVGGLEMEDIHADIVARCQGGEDRLSRNRNVPVYRKEVTRALQLVARGGNGQGEYDRFARLLASTPPVYLRDLLELTPASEPLDLEQVVPAEEVVRGCFRGAAMSHGALHATAHRAIAAAFNHFGALSNSGEGGEDERRNPGGPLEADRDRVRQVASGRFGVDAAYLAGADELEVKIGQGAKPGEGGHLPGSKVTGVIAAIRKVKAGVTLISPPPHHDIYSIEDLAQLITNLRQCNPRAAVSVKVPAVSNLGTIAVGVAKAGAEVITVSGFEGGTGAAHAGSILHAGLPLDRGLSEAHQHLVLAGIRGRVRLRADGGLKCGLDVAKVLALGADEVAFGTPLLVAENCVYCRGCSHGRCPEGIATQDGEVHARFMRRHRPAPAHAEASEEQRYQEARDGVVRYLRCVAEDLRGLLAAMGLRHPRELVGRVDLLARRPGGNPRWDRLHLGELLANPREQGGGEVAGRQPGAVISPANQQALNAAAPVLSGEADRAVVELVLDNRDRALGATLAASMARSPAAAGEVELCTSGTAGQGLGFAACRGMKVRHAGYANDGVASAMGEGALVVVRAPQGLPEAPHLVGNAAAYGATGGALLVGGRAGQRFGVRNSGALLVAEAVGKYAFEYMTGGTGLVLGPCGPCLGSGMTGGELFLLEGQPLTALHPDVAVARDGPLPADELDRLRRILRRYIAETGSRRAQDLLQWGVNVPVRRVVPRDQLQNPSSAAASGE